MSTREGIDGRIGTTEAASRLGVKPETIYAYVSRGLLTSERAPDGKSSTFDAAEIDRFRRRKGQHRPGRLEVAVTSSVSEVVDGSVGYRGRPLDELVDAGATYEQVAELLWAGELAEPPVWSAGGKVASAVRRAARALPSYASPTDRMMAGVVAAGAADPFRDDRSSTGATASARRLIRATVDALPVVSEETEADVIADRLWVRLTQVDPVHARLLDVALVVLAEHGMATSTLAARLAASTRAAPHAILLAGLGAVSGPLHGAASRTVHRMFEDAEANGPEAAIAEVMRRDGRVPGIGHFIHRTRDPRQSLLFRAITEHAVDPARIDVVDSVRRLTGERIRAVPNVDLALGAMTYITGMGPEAGEVIFACARTAGWVAHALEEYDEPPIRFRPVGRYVANRRGR